MLEDATIMSIVLSALSRIPGFRYKMLAAFSSNARRGRMSNLVMIHANHARIDGDVLTINRKLHIGMKDYVEKINAPLVTLHPQAARDASIMDHV